MTASAASATPAPTGPPPVTPAHAALVLVALIMGAMPAAGVLALWTGASHAQPTPPTRPSASRQTGQSDNDTTDRRCYGEGRHRQTGLSDFDRSDRALEGVGTGVRDQDSENRAAITDAYCNGRGPGALRRPSRQAQIQILDNNPWDAVIYRPLPKPRRRRRG